MQKLNIRIHGKFGAHHSWSHTMRSIAFEFYKLGHNLFITSTDGYSLAPHELKNSYEKDIDNADIDICYTLPINYKQWFNKTSKLKLAIFNWESTIMPETWHKCISDVDYILPSSTCVYDIFKNNGFDEKKLKIINLGIDWDKYIKSEPINISGLNDFVFLNVSIPHHRKNLDIVLDSYYSSFDINDNVSLILKSSFINPKNKFECSLSEIISSVQSRYSKQLPKVHVITDIYDDMAPLYKRADCVISASSFEGFGLPLLEGLGAGCQIIAPKTSGQLDFLNENNSFLINVDKIKAGEKYQYWKENKNSETFLPRRNEIIEAMQSVYSGNKKPYDHSLYNNFSWKSVANNILKIREGIL